ncbi:unnamed protein product [Bursaphelenchus xylophilus]|uniref:(pine wood nematode) hypothetical protein n=1 Tax=Bursaphelenchus xylophilus TaxID=6326 RepID=A0A1I7SH06_BURXY|nr:unnamed protein product [Bursaphelenchus xylophilus]CAG9080110.1 unnamed protein product [Bursaphelenchus xylophilus]
MLVKFVAEPGATPEHILIEVQGAIEPPMKPAGKTVLFLYWKDPTTAVCLIGHYMLEGSLKKLEKPFLVVDTRSVKPTGEGEYNCRVACVIRQKMAFKSRPKPILC